MRYPLFHYLGGFLWWILIRFWNTKLENEQSDDKWSRNIFFLIVIGIFTAFITIRFF
ncbi:hypothetical protein FLAPXU55_00670 [Flavobacterium panici]|uniref:Uncharacterized protein n=1 Tax=Flavobacterium panici TaxID=2654843 RepID=A0A9N8P0F3_9FLAO|nr:hypothetical protein FLAPXU55_00670 [Flavobacterium panici]